MAKSAPHDDVRSARVEIRVTEGEKAEISRRAAACRMSLTDYIVTCTLRSEAAERLPALGRLDLISAQLRSSAASLRNVEAQAAKLASSDFGAMGPDPAEKVALAADRLRNFSYALEIQLASAYEDVGALHKSCKERND